MSHVFITGGSGFVGAHVVRAYLEAGWEVTVFGPSPKPCLTKFDLAHISFHKGDVTRYEDIDQALSKTHPELVVGLAAYGATGLGLLTSAATNEAAALQVNVNGFHNLLKGCHKHGTPRVLWASTLAVFGNPTIYPDGTVYDDSIRAPETFYGMTKVLAENIACFFQATHGLVLTGLRLPLVFGPGLWYEGVASKIKHLFEAAIREEKIEIPAPAQAFDLMYVKDVGRAFIHLANYTGRLEQIYNLTAYSESASSIANVIRQIRPASEITVKPVESGHLYPTVNGQKIEKTTGFSYKFDLHEACEDYINELTKA